MTWCVTHKRDHARCKAGDGGILIPCRVVPSEDAGRRILAVDKECARLLDWDDHGGILVPHPVTHEELGRVLAIVYPDPADRSRFMDSYQDLLPGVTPMELVESGRVDVVVRLLRQIADGVYL